jgi:hydrogenase maturation protein HypF
MWLEAIADHTEQGEYGPALIEEDDILTVDSYALARSVADDIAKGTSTGKIAARFHRTLARATAEALTSASEKFNAPIIGLSGGCFQNKLLVELIVALLRESGRECLLHRTVPPNDGGLAVGQVFAATSGRTRSEPGDRT